MFQFFAINSANDSSRMRSQQEFFDRVAHSKRIKSFQGAQFAWSFFVLVVCIVLIRQDAFLDSIVGNTCSTCLQGASVLMFLLMLLGSVAPVGYSYIFSWWSPFKIEEWDTKRDSSGMKPITPTRVSSSSPSPRQYSAYSKSSPSRAKSPRRGSDSYMTNPISPNKNYNGARRGNGTGNNTPTGANTFDENFGEENENVLMRDDQQAVFEEMNRQKMRANGSPYQSPSVREYGSPYNNSPHSHGYSRNEYSQTTGHLPTKYSWVNAHNITQDNISAISNGLTYNPSPASEAQTSHVLSSGLMLQTKNAFHSLEGGSGEKLSYGEIDFWIESLRKLLYSHVKDELKLQNNSFDSIFRPFTGKFHQSQANSDALRKILKCETMQIQMENLTPLAGVPPNTQKLYTEAEIWASVYDAYKGEPSWKKRLDVYRQSQSIFIPMRTSERVRANAGDNSHQLKHKVPAMVSRLRDIAEKQRLPLEDSQSSHQDSRYQRQNAGGNGDGNLSTPDVVMSIFSHFWGTHCSKIPSSQLQPDHFQQECFAATTQDLHSMTKPSAAIVKSIKGGSVHFDVFCALDDRYGPTIMEINDGRHNCCQAIIIFLIFLYKSKTYYTYRNQDLSSIRKIAENILKLIFRDRLQPKESVHNYLSRFVDLPVPNV